MQFSLANNVIVGQGLTALYTADFLSRHGKPFWIYSHQENRLPKYRSHYTQILPKEYSQIWMSPGISEKDQIVSELDPDKIIIDLDYFLSHYQHPVIMVTGTNGKSTSCLYLKTMLEQLGFSVNCFGNYQPGVLTLLDNPVDFTILEMSSFQLSWLKYQGKVSACVCLNLGVDHVSWHGGLSQYHRAKKKMMRLSKLTIGIGGQYDFHNRAKKLRGYLEDEALNLSAAIVTLEKLGLKPSIPTKLPKLPYRQNQYHWRDKLIVNDSKSTTIASTIMALKNITSQYPSDKILLIMGGVEKGENPQYLMPFLNQAEVIVIGQGFQEIPLKKRYDYIDEAVSDILHHKGIVLFSPGGASYDQYRDYQERGAAFDRLLRSCEAS